MAKPSTQLLLMQALKEIERLEAELARRDAGQRDRDWYTMVQSQDMAMLALSEAFGFGQERLKRFAEAYQSVWTEISELTLKDAEHDKTIEHSSTRFEERLQKICGEYYVPRDERYKEGGTW